MTSRRSVLAAALAIGVTLVSAACTSNPLAETPTAAPSVTLPAPGPTPTPTSSVPPAAPTCENIITATSLGHLTEQGLVVTPSAEYAEKVRSEGYARLALFADNGGVLCPWGGTNTEYSVAYAFSPISDEQAATEEASLESDGYFASSYAGGTVYTDLTGFDPLWSHYLFLDGYWFAGTGVELLDELVLTAPR